MDITPDGIASLAETPPAAAAQPSSQTPAPVAQTQAGSQAQPSPRTDSSQAQPAAQTQAPDQLAARPSGQASAQHSEPAASQPISQPATAPEPEPDARPIADWKDVGDLGVDPALLDAGMVESFGAQAVDIGLTPAQARALAKWQTDYMARAHEESLKTERAALDKAWGASAGANIQKVVNLCARLDREPGLAGFSEALAKSGAASNALVVRGLYSLAQALGEDAAGRLNGAARTVETPYDGIVAAFAKARERRP